MYSKEEIVVSFLDIQKKRKEIVKRKVIKLSFSVLFFHFYLFNHLNYFDLILVSENGNKKS